MPKRSAKEKLTTKEAKLVKGVAAGKTKRQAAKEAGYTGSDEVVSTTASRALNKANVQEALYLALQKQGLTPDDIMNPVADALKNDELDMRLKGHDRAMKIINPRADRGDININFNSVANNEREEYGI